ncbi:hypothetical protein ACO0QE_003423 [Hanseniaspora vineae]
MILGDIETKGLSGASTDEKIITEKKACVCSQLDSEFETKNLCCIYSTQETELSQENHNILNQLIEQLSNKLRQSCLEYADLLLEDLMYPKGVENSVPLFSTSNSGILNENYSYLVSDLGNTTTLEVLHIKKLLKKEYSRDCAAELKQMEKLHVCFVVLLRNLSAYLEIPNAFHFFKELLKKNMINFERLFKLFKKYKQIITILLDCAFSHDSNLSSSGNEEEKSKSGNEEDCDIFQIKEQDLQLIQDFSLENSKWLEEMLHGSKAYKEYLQQNSQVSKKLKYDDIEFGSFLKNRKNALRISSRTL